MIGHNTKKIEELEKISDEDGIIRAVGIGTIGKIAHYLGNMLETSTFNVLQEVKEFKKLVIEELSHFYSAISTDAEIGLPIFESSRRKNCGLILSVQDRKNDKSVPTEEDTKINLISLKSERYWKNDTINAYKLTLHYRDELQEEVKEKLKETAVLIGQLCQKIQKPYILEIICFPLSEETELDFAKKLPDAIIKIAEHFSERVYSADILKIDFPAELRYCKNFSRENRMMLYSLSEVEDFCKSVTEASKIPWVVLSGGGDIEQFKIKVEISSRNGASGFLGGRALWLDALNEYPDKSKMIEWLKNKGKEYYETLLNCSREGRPIFSK